MEEGKAGAGMERQINGQCKSIISASEAKFAVGITILVHCEKNTCRLQ